MNRHAGSMVVSWRVACAAASPRSRCGSLSHEVAPPAFGGAFHARARVPGQELAARAARANLARIGRASWLRQEAARRRCASAAGMESDGGNDGGRMWVSRFRVRPVCRCRYNGVLRVPRRRRENESTSRFVCFAGRLGRGRQLGSVSRLGRRLGSCLRRPGPVGRRFAAGVSALVVGAVWDPRGGRMRCSPPASSLWTTECRGVVPFDPWCRPAQRVPRGRCH